MPLKLFISYRHDDNTDFVKKICKQFKGNFGAENVFIDTDIPPGAKWQETLKQEVLKSDAIVVMIGPRWLELLDEKRINVKEDYVYFELELAIRNKKRLFPICIQGAAPPPKTQLPEDLQPLLDVQFSFLSVGATFPTEFDKLLDKVKAELNTSDVSSPLISVLPASSQPFVQTCPTPPPEPDRFGGRTLALAKLCDSLERGDFSALTAVHGLGGIGKTTLAIKAVNDLFKQKVFRAVLHAKITRDPDPVAILETWARNANSHYVRPPAAKPEDIASNVKNLLEATINATCEQCEPSRILVLLDDVWNDSEGRGKAAIRLLRQACPAGSTLLITTRFEGLAIDLGANPQSLDRLTPEEGAEFLQTYEYLAPLDKRALQALSEVLDGHALALDLAAKRIGKTANKLNALHDHTIEYRNKIPLGMQFKDIKLDQGDTREENLTLVLSYSYDDLDPEDQTRFRQLGILPPDVVFDLPTLAAIWGVFEDKAVIYCDTLRLSSLIDLAPDIGDFWYRQHRLLRAYAYALALHKDTGETESVFDRYADIVTEVAENYQSLRPEQWGILTPFLPHILAVGSRLVEQTKDIASNTDEVILRRAQLFARNMSNYLYNRREVRHINWMEMGLRVSQALKDEISQALFLNDLGLLTSTVGDKRQALNYFEQALNIYRQLENKRGEATMLNNIGGVYADLEERSRALGYYEQALIACRQLENKQGEAVALNNIGRIYAALGHTKQALDYIEKSLLLQRELGDRQREAGALLNLGRIYDDIEDNQIALDFYEKALAISRIIGDKSGEITTLNHIANIHIRENSLDQATKTIRQVIVLMETTDAPAQVAFLHGNLANLLRNMGQIAEGITELEEAIRILQQHNLQQDTHGITIQQTEAVIARWRWESGPLAGELLPDDMVKMLISNTVVVKTGESEKLTAWRATLQGIRNKDKGHEPKAGKVGHNEIAFIDALIAMLDNHPVAIPTSNPYYLFVQQAINAIIKRHENT